PRPLRGGRRARGGAGLTLGLRQRCRTLLECDQSPHRIALAFALGVCIAWSPLFGAHTVMALAVAWRWRLNRAALLLGAYLNNPWTIAPIYALGTALGCALLGISGDGLAGIDWDLEGLA